MMRDDYSWIRVTCVAGDSVKNVVWDSTVHDITASRNEHWIDHFEHRRGIHHSFDLERQILYRVPEHRPHQIEQFRGLVSATPRALESDDPIRDLLNALRFLLGDLTKTELVGQRIETVEENSQTWLDYSLTIRHADLPDAADVRLRIDSVSGLPRSLRIECAPKVAARQWQFDYLESGPASIHDLGVPSEVQCVDRTPPEQLEHILETIRAGRAEMDDYRAIVVQRTASSRAPWWLGNPPMIIYRKGNNFRVDAGWFRDRAPWNEKPLDDESQESWWRRRIKAFLYYPRNIVRGSVEHCIKVRGIDRPDGSPLMVVESVEARDMQGNPGWMVPPYYSRQPEFICRPPMGIPSRDMNPTLESHVGSNLQSQVILTVRRERRLSQACGGNSTCGNDSTCRSRTPDAWRRWLDPARGYAAVRSDMLEGEPDAETCFHSTIIDDMAQSPSGVWYATRFKTVGEYPDNLRIETDTQLYVDFDIDLHDAFFDPPAVGQRFE